MGVKQLLRVGAAGVPGQGEDKRREQEEEGGKTLIKSFFAPCLLRGGSRSPSRGRGLSAAAAAEPVPAWGGKDAAGSAGKPWKEGFFGVTQSHPKVAVLGGCWGAEPAPGVRFATAQPSALRWLRFEGG